MVAALFEGDLRYALAIFGKPRTIDGVIVPSSFALPNGLTLRGAVEYDLELPPGVELFRVLRLPESQGLTLFALCKSARGYESGREGCFIGTGVFAAAGVDPRAVVQSLREMLANAEQALIDDNRKFTVETIGENVKRRLAVPDSADSVRNTNAPFVLPIAASNQKGLMIRPSSGLHSPELFFEMATLCPDAFAQNTFFCADESVIQACQINTQDFRVLHFDHALWDLTAGYHRVRAELATTDQRIQARTAEARQLALAAQAAQQNAELESRDWRRQFNEAQSQLRALEQRASRHELSSRGHQNGRTNPAISKTRSIVSAVAAGVLYVVLALLVTRQLEWRPWSTHDMATAPAAPKTRDAKK